MSRWSVGKEGSRRIGERGRSSEEASARERGGSVEGGLGERERDLGLFFFSFAREGLSPLFPQPLALTC